jgi:hypothetical protein
MSFKSSYQETRVLETRGMQSMVRKMRFRISPINMVVKTIKFVVSKHLVGFQNQSIL